MRNAVGRTPSEQLVTARPNENHSYFLYEGSGFLALSICSQANTLSQVQFSQFATRFLLFLIGTYSYCLLLFFRFWSLIALIVDRLIIIILFCPLIVSHFRAYNGHLFLLLAVFNFCIKNKALYVPTLKIL
ncbi:hypothetical protein ACL7TT_03015 [Microbulbifer sp. 2304DJ12-6]|uniref:hypothetical protein n=1 Tax=Microbulbifer sp. 2304DJ12-6 TaxID=3233340 RepID=UPI0039AF2DCA